MVMKNLYYILLLASATLAMACGDDIDDNFDYGSYAESPIKSVDCAPLFVPLPVSDGSVVTITQNGSEYSFVKILQDGTTQSTQFDFEWSMSNSVSPMMPGGPDSPDDVTEGGSLQNSDVPNIFNQEVDIELDNCTFRKNSSDEFYWDFYSSDHFGRHFFAVVKFDKDCNIVFKLDSTANLMGGGPMMDDKTGGVSKQPVKGTPLNNGGYAMILQASSMGMAVNTDYNLLLRIIDAQGKYVKDCQLDFSETVEIEVVTNVNNNIAIYYKLSDDSYYYNVYSQDGALVGVYPIESTDVIFSSLTYGNYAYLSYANTETLELSLRQLDENGEVVQTIPLNAIVMLNNATEVDGKFCFSGTAVSDVSLLLDNSSVDATDYQGIIALASNGVMEEPIIADYNNGVIVFATFKNDDGSYIVYLTQLTPLSWASSRYGDKIYIYRTDDLKKLEVN